ncbi:DUF1189 domain-containing protein [Parablautia muri]|uniref:DUF1189 domain-containing protein n=1 Tax=Parablautia muri TaxID=2320879 RepID=A0A9X5GR16_9FIRM|nr:DUF1189 domain-containing protein [Parablautia muri]NBJ91869.1 DUF1189 domain-containing protein [Parablautia muri]
MNIFKEMALSIYSYKSYKEFLNNKKSKVFLFGIVLMLIYFAITMLIPFAKFQIRTGGIGALLDENIPDFELSDGELWVEDVIEYDEGSTYVCIDTDPEYVFYDADEMEEYLYSYTNVILMDSEKMILKSSGEVQGFYFSDLDFACDKEDWMRWVPFINLIIVMFMILAYIWMSALFFFGVLFVALLGMVAASCMKHQITFGQLYLLGIYSRTLPLLIKAVISFLPINIPFFVIINFGISVFIIVRAIQNLKEQQLNKPLEFRTDTGYHGENHINGDGSNGSNGNDFSWMK